ncbi:MAG: hypothetical protein U5K74_08745 [Gemmatimonadaceae bacterium]|nr:hypothetical protein [Gemmatimonadaceae bacterium]
MSFPILRSVRPSRLSAIILLLSLPLTGCISYTVGQGAETTAVGERAYSSSLNLVPGTLSDLENSASTR